VVNRPSNKYFVACSTGNVPAVAEFLESGVPPESRDRNGLTGLIWAGRRGRIEVADLLLAKGASTEAVDGRGRTALYHAVTFKRYGFVEHLARLGANVNVVDEHGCTPREIAEIEGDEKMAASLATFGATSSGQTRASMLYIGEVIGGPELDRSPIVTALRRVFVARGEEDAVEGTRLDVVFHVPGSVLKPDFAGVRTGSLSRKTQMLQVQVAVPPEMVNADEDEGVGFCLGALRNAVDAADARLAKAGMPFDARRLRDLVDRMQARLVH
jgi:Ankyrin repeats (3 copies)